MRSWLWLPAVYLTAALQTSLASRLALGRVVPDLLALFAITWVVCDRRPTAPLVAAAVGLIADLASAGRVGLGAAAFLVVSVLVQQLAVRLPLRHAVVQVPLAGLAITLIAAAVGIAHSFGGGGAASSGGWGGLILTSLSVGAYSACLSLPVFLVIGWVSARRPELIAPVN